MYTRIGELRSSKIAHVCVLVLFFSLAGNSFCNAQATFYENLKSSVLNGTGASDSLILTNRLLIKPFTDKLISESIILELRGKSAESEKLRKAAEEVADKFKNILGEESLSIGVTYLSRWSKDQKKQKLEADSIYSAGTRKRLNNEPDSALYFFRRALGIYNEIGDERGEAEVLGGFGAVYFSKQDSELAARYYTSALIKRVKVDDKVLIGNTLNSFGSVYYTFRKNYIKAIEYYRKAEALRAETGDDAALRTTRSYLVNAYSGWADNLENDGKYSEALGKFESALNISDSCDLKDQKGKILNQIGLVYFRLGDYTTAADRLSQAVSIMKELQDSSGLAGVYNHFGIVLQNAGRYEKATHYYYDALEIYQLKKQKTDQLPVLSNLGTIFIDQKDYPKASDYLKLGLAIARESDDKDVEADFLLNLGNSQILSGSASEAIASYEEALRLNDELSNPDRAFRILLGMAEYYETTEDYPKVIQLNDSALKIIDRLRRTIEDNNAKATYIAKERYIFEDIIDLLASLSIKYGSMDYDKLAFTYSEASKSRVLSDMLSGAMTDYKPCTINEAGGMLGKEEILLEYSVGDSSSCLWVIKNSDYRLFKIAGRSEIQENIELLRFALADPTLKDNSFLIKPAARLYDILIRPAASFLTQGSKLIIIPDDILNYLPFEVLLTDNNRKNEPYSKLPYLLRKYPVSYAQSADVLRTMLAKSDAGIKSIKGKPTLLAFGDPVYDAESYQKLVFSGAEISEIGSYFKKNSFRSFLGQDATERTVKNETNAGTTYLHFAAHGFIDEKNPNLSALILSKDKDSSDDGYLQPSEISTLKLDAELVVLSACQTGIGKLIRGEGMIGLTRAFMYAGAKSVLVSLWNVSDYSTSRLMNEFYRNLIKNKLDKSISLRKAQMSLISDEKYAHPFYWAPFVLLGNWR